MPVYQQQFGNALKGAAFVFDLGTICIAHLGDLAHKLTEEQIKAFGKVDIAMIPIGGTFTMPPDTAREVLQQLKPKIAIPMHYRESTHLLDMFVKGFPNKYLNTHHSTLQQDGLAAADADHRLHTVADAGLPVKRCSVRWSTAGRVGELRLNQILNASSVSRANSSSRTNFCFVSPCSNK